MTRSRALAAAGLAAFGLALAALAAPGAFALGLDRPVVTIVGVLALVQSLRIVRGRLGADRRWFATPDPERLPAVPPPGDTLEDAIRQVTDSGAVYHFGSRLRRNLESIAVAVLVRYRNCSEAEARDAIARGTWTDDPYAAAFLGDDVDPPLLGRLREALPGSNGGAVARTADAIADVAGLPASSSDDSARPGTAVRRRLGRTGGRDGARSGEPAEDRFPARRSTNRWYGISVVALVGIAAGVLSARPSVVLAGGVGIGYAAYARASTLPDVALSAERSLSTERPDPGDAVEVTVRVTNEGDRVLPDVRLVDGVPDALPVAEGSPRLGTALRPGGTATIRYSLTARRGVHEFRPSVAVAGDLAAATEDGRTVSVETTLTCLPSLRPLAAGFPLRAVNAPHVGSVPTAAGGEGTEFFATRDYRAGDPLNRIDWNRRARTGDLATLEFREERAATVVLVVDAREAAYLAPRSGDEHAVDRSVEAAGRVFATALAAGDRAGIAAIGSGDCWLAPGSGRAHRARARRLLATDPALGAVPSETVSNARDWTAHLRRRLPSAAQVVLFSPLCDMASPETARQIDAHGYPVTVVSPDPTADDAPSRRLARVGRHARVSDLRGAGVPVIDWPWGTSLDAAVARFADRRSR